MFRSLHMKLVLILVLLIVSVMAVVGTFLINGVSSYFLDSFQQQVSGVFTQSMISSLKQSGAGPNGAEEIAEIVSAHEIALGIDNSTRNYYILDNNGEYLLGSNETLGAELTRSSNIIAAMAGKVGDSASMLDSQMDIAIPIDTADARYIVYIADDKRGMSEMSWRFFTIVMQAMMFGLLAAILLSFLLSKTITTPIERIRQGARKIAQGEYAQHLGVQSSDEIGELTQSFNNMADRLASTVGEVQSERDKLSTLFLHMTDGVAAFTTAGELIHMNPATETMLGIRHSERLTFDEMFADLSMPDHEETAMRSFLTSEITRGNRVLSVTLAPYGALDGEGGVIAVLHDVTEQRKLDESRREFVANVSHELRTPLTNIRSYTETLQEAAGELPQQTEQQFLGVIASESERMAHIVTDLLTLSRLDYGRMDLKFQPFSLYKMLEHVYQANRLTAEDTGHTLTWDVPDDLPDIVGDKGRLEQVAVNILSNAIKYTPQDGHIVLSARPVSGDRVRITIEDDGVGIPEQDVPRLFERFYRVDKARSRAAGGTGLGLAIAKEIVEQHEGKIAVASEYGKGTTVSVTLPVHLTPTPEEEA